MIHQIIKRCYHKNVIDHFNNPQNVGALQKNNKNVGTGLVGAPACGDVMKLQIEVDDKGYIINTKFKTFGCASAIASSSVASEMIRGMHISEACKIKNQEISKYLDLPPVKLHCSMLAQDAIQQAVANFLEKKKVTVLKNKDVE